LGETFLKHVERCGLMVHMLDPFQIHGYREDLAVKEIAQNILTDYKIIRKEMEKWDKNILLKSELVLLNKSDLLSESQCYSIMSDLTQYFGSNYDKISPTFYIAKKPFMGSKMPVGVAYCSTYSGIGVKDITDFFNKYYDNIIQSSHAQIVKESEQSKILRIDISNLPNKRIFFKYDKV